MPVTAAEKCPDLPTKIDAAIKAFNDSIRGAEYCEYREAATGDLDGDHREDVAVRFSIEGPCGEDVESVPGACGNNYEFFLIALLAKNEALISPIKTGGKAIRHIKDISVGNGRISLDVLEYSDGDAMCCPSIEKETAYQIKQGRFVEIEL